MKTNLTKSILTTAAQMFGGSSDIKVTHGVPRTDGRYVYLPGLKPDLTPTEAMVVRGYFAHEVAHIKYDSFSQGSRRIISPTNAVGLFVLGFKQLHEMFNCTEDIRIESLVMRDNIGAAATISAIRFAGLTKNNENNPFGGNSPANKRDVWGQITHAIIWRMSGPDWESRISYCPVGFQILDELPIPATLIPKFLDKVKSGKATATDAARLALGLTKIVDAYFADINDGTIDPPEPEAGDSNDLPEEEGDADGDTEDGDESQESGDSDSSDDADDADDSEEDATDGDTPIEGGEGDIAPEDSDSSKNGQSWGDSNEDVDASEWDPIKEITKDAIDDLARKDDNGDYKHSPNEGEINEGSILSFYKAITDFDKACLYAGTLKEQVNYSQLHADAMRLGRTLRPMLESVDKVGWSQPRESGNRVDMRRVHQLASGVTNRVFNVRRLARAEKTLVTIFVDYSSSMRGKVWDSTYRASLTIADACESIGVPTAIIGFGSKGWIEKQPGVKMTPQTVTHYAASGGTNMPPALLLAAGLADRYPAHRNVQFVLTDGKTCGMKETIALLRSMKEGGATQYGISLEGGMSYDLQNYFLDTGDGYSDVYLSGDKDGLVSRLEECLKAYANQEGGR